jgi:hypothetical protein
VVSTICLVLLISVGAEAGPLGHITGDVNFRKTPDTSMPPIGRLSVGTEVEVIKRTPGGWYFIVYRGRPGFIHKDYITLDQPQSNSLFCVSFGVFGLFLFFKRKKKERTSPADQISPRKAA